MTKKTSLVFMAALLLTVNNQCTKAQFCENKALCDLFSKTILPVAGILLGVNLTIVSTVYNVAASNVDCTGDAGLSKSDFDVEFRNDASSPWQIVQNVSDQVLQVGALIADGNPDNSDVNLIFNMPGQYRFRTASDHDFEVPERDDNNNGSCAGCRVDVSSSNNVSYSEILTVYENPNITYNPSKPPVEIVNITKRK